jgi:glycosyltransferase involved in cell wall biosynthesis
MSRRYCLITPCRDEAAHLQTTIDSVVAQTVRPAKWIIVDDGSKDDTPAICARAAAQYPFIQVIRRDDRGKRAVGPGVIEAFYDGLRAIDMNDFDYICKFDGDLDLPKEYFEIIMQRVEADPRIGTCSGKPYFHAPDSKELISEACGDEMSVGMIKFYRVRCFQQIGGFVRQVMWDGIDCHRCRMLGWIAVSWDDPEIRFVHLRPMGSSDTNIIKGRVRHGFGQYFMGTGPVYLVASAIFRMTRRPFIVGGLAMIWGYFRSMIQRVPRYEDLEFRRFLRRYQWDCLLRGKSRATARLNVLQSQAWKPAVTEPTGRSMSALAGVRGFP